MIKATHIGTGICLMLSLSSCEIEYKTTRSIKIKKLNTMYKQTRPSKTTLRVNDSYEGETIEKKVNRIVNNKEPIKDGAPQIFTDRKDGVKPEYDIRTDRFELAVEAMDRVSKDKLAKRQGKAGKEDIGTKAIDGMKKENGGAEPISATDN